MSLFDDSERGFLHAVASLFVANPFLPERIEAERAALGGDFVERGKVWSMRESDEAWPENQRRIRARLAPLMNRASQQLHASAAASDVDRKLYHAGCLYLLRDAFEKPLQRLVVEPGERADGYGDFVRAYEWFLVVSGIPEPGGPAHLFACFFQMARAFHHIFTCLLGESLPAARLRAAVWRSIFSWDIHRYRRSLYARMDDISTLVTGPTGTGKEVVARAIGLSRYVAFDEGTLRFAENPAAHYHPLNLSALSPSIVEAELFGHERGAFTGAVGDRAGWLETCKPGGTLFLDEIGEVDTVIQVKLLRVLVTRRFERLGGTRACTFSGGVVAATHRDLVERMRSGHFREDLYYRLCSNHIETPSLRAQLDDAPGERRHLVRFIAAKVAGLAEAGALAEEVEAWIEKHLPANYAWPGNVRELEQRVRQVMMQGDRSAAAAGVIAGGEDAARPFLDGTLTLEEALRRYVTIVYMLTGNYREAGRRLGMDQRTVRSKVDRKLLATLTGR